MQQKRKSWLLSGHSSERPGKTSICSRKTGKKPVRVAQGIYPALKTTLYYTGNSRWQTDFVQTFCQGFPHPPEQMINIKPKIFRFSKIKSRNVSRTRCQFSLGYKWWKQVRKSARRRGSRVCSASQTQEVKVRASGWRRQLHGNRQASITGKFWVDLKQKFLPMEVVKHWDRSHVVLELGKINWPIASWCFFEVRSTLSMRLA